MCTITDSQIREDGKIVGNALESIANLLKAVNADLADKLMMAATAFINVTSDWNSSSPKALFDDAAKVVEEVLADIPQTAIFAPFVAIAVAALDILIANIGTKPEPLTTVSVRATMFRIEALPSNPWRGQANIVHRHMHSLRDDFRHAWNSEVDNHPSIGISKI